MKRQRDIDALKGFGILLVVLGHVNPGFYIEKWIYSFHMFLFFFLAGITFSKKGFKTRLMLDIKNLLFPYLFWNGICIMFSLIIGEYSIADALKYLLFIEKVSWNAPIWFLVVLFFLRVLGEVVLSTNTKLCDRVKYICSLLIAFILGYICVFPRFLGFDIVPTVFIFFCLGYIYKMNNKNINIFFIIFLIGLNVYLSFINERISVYGNYYGRYVIAVIAGVCGVLACYYTAKRLYARFRLRILEILGIYSFNIMCSHYLILRFFNYLSIQLCGYDLWHSVSIIKAILVTVMVIVLELLLVYIMKKFRIPSTKIWRIGKIQ
jgi:acyltransferase